MDEGKIAQNIEPRKDAGCSKGENNGRVAEEGRMERRKRRPKKRKERSEFFSAPWM